MTLYVLELYLIFSKLILCMCNLFWINNFFRASAGRLGWLGSRKPLPYRETYHSDGLTLNCVEYSTDKVCVSQAFFSRVLYKFSLAVETKCLNLRYLVSYTRFKHSQKINKDNFIKVKINSTILTEYDIKHS